MLFIFNDTHVTRVMNRILHQPDLNLNPAFHILALRYFRSLPQSFLYFSFLSFKVAIISVPS